MRPGDQIDIWVVEKALGSGGMGSVYRCHNRSAKRILAAVKVLDPALRRVSGAEERFVREAEILFSLDHPNIVKVRNVRIDGNPPYLEMEFVEGQSLDRMLHRAPLPWPEAHDIFRQLCAASSYLHSRGVCHRDIKPANVLVDANGRMKLVDFGLAMEAGQSRLTQSNTTFGTVSYAPPEWIRPEDLDPEKWDIYSAGVVTWEMLNGKVAFPVSGMGSARQQAMQVIIAKQGHPPLDPGPRFHDDLRQLIQEMTAAEPEDRPASMDEVYERVLALDPTPKANTNETLTPAAATPEGAPDSTWVDGPTPATPQLAMRTEWAKALADTPVPAEPVHRRPSEADTLITGELILGWLRGTRTWLVVALALAAVAVGVMGALLMVQNGNRSGAGPAVGPAVDVVVDGLRAGTEAGVRLDGEAARSRTSWVWRFGPRPPGTHTLTWAIGPGCAAADCPGESCPSWCGAGTTEVAVDRGVESQVLHLPLSPPPLREVVVNLPDDLGSIPVRVRLNMATRSQPGTTARFERVPPGRHDLAVDVGSCTAPDRGCLHDDTCPAGCASWATVAEIPWGEGPWSIDAPVRAPVPAATPHPRPSVTPTSVAPPPPDDPAPQPVQGTGEATPGAVTAGEFAAWLASRPSWHREAAIEGGLADDGYLASWEGTTPPAGKGAHAVRGVSWYAAAAYCKDRGGLAPLDAEPLSWEESDSRPYLEWRTEGGKAAWRSADGRSSTRVRLDEANAFTGFRCAR